VTDESGSGRVGHHRRATSHVATGSLAQKRRLAAAMRQVIASLVRSDAPEDELRQAADGLERYSERLASHPRLMAYEGFAETSPSGDASAFFDKSPLIGLSNPLAPPIVIEVTGDQTCRGTVTFGDAYEGPPGCVHGGFIAAAFDEVLGFAQSLTGQPGFTGTLTVVYRKPTPLQTELHFDARVVRIERRKIFAHCELHAGDLLCAESEGIFVSADKERFEALMTERDRREAERRDG
jgi:acyl-coenzyme A thioesterase PaaI-like protein